MKNFITKLINILFNDEYYKARTNLNSSLSMVINVIWALIKIFTGLWTRAFVLCISGFFTMGLGLCKVCYFKDLNKKEKQYKSVINISIILLISSIIYTVYMIILFFYPEDPRNYGIYLSLIIAVVAFLKLFFSIRGIHKMRKQHEPLVMAIKGVNLSGALANIVLTQACLLVLGNEVISNKTLSLYNAITGTVAGCISIGISILMLVVGVKKKLSKNEIVE